MTNSQCNCPCHDVTKQYPVSRSKHTELCNKRAAEAIRRMHSSLGRDGNRHTRGAGNAEANRIKYGS